MANRSFVLRFVCVSLLICVCILGWSQNQAAPAATPQASPTPPFTAPVDISIPQAPTAFQGDAKTHLVYELHISNYSGQPVTLTHIEVLNEKGAELARLGQTELLASVRILGPPEATGMDKLNIPGGKTALVYMWGTLANPAAVPTTLRHKLSLKVGTYPEELSIQCARVAVSRDLAVISAPLRGDNWLAANGPANSSGHRRSIIPIDGRARIAQRFAIDWVRVNPDGQATYTGDPLDNKNYRAYGSEALAVADGTIVATKDGIPQNIPGENSRAVPITLETVGGNHVVLDIGHGRFAFYAHLQPGSLKVKTGDHVKRGQVLGLVGNSGNSTEPHLHFHLADSKSALGSEGLPYVLDSFDAKTKSGDVRKHKQEIPLEDELVTFEK